MVQAYLLDSARDEMIAENAAIALVYSGEAPYATEYNDDLAYVVPKEGSNVWVDSWAVTKDCKNTENAEKFLNYLLRVDISKISFEYNHYGTPNKKLAEILPAKYTEDPALFPPSAVLDNCEIFRSLDRGRRIITVGCGRRLNWTKKFDFSLTPDAKSTGLQGLAAWAGATLN